MDDFSEQYFDPRHEAAFSGARNLIRVNKDKFTPAQVGDWLKKHDAYTLHKTIRRKFPRLFYDVNALDQLWEADLAQMTSLKSYNDGVEYILVVIDVLSKFVWAEPMRAKTNREVVEAFGKILDNKEKRRPCMLQTDRGKEFVGKEFQNFLKSYDIQFRVARNPDVKAAVVERFIRTLKERMYRYFTFKNTHRYIDVLQDLIAGYNKTPHSTIKMPPSAVSIYNAHIARKNLVEARHGGRKKQRRRRRRWPFKIGDYVRISREKNVFEKGAVKSWSEEIFKVARVLQKQELVVYELDDLDGERIEGFFYPQELNLVDAARATNSDFKIDQILRTRGKGKNKQYFVSWLGYPEKFNSWVLAREVRKL